MSWVGVAPPRKRGRLVVVEQNLPGDAPVSEEESRAKGLPDIVIHDGDIWGVIIESKIQTALSDDELVRHRRTMGRKPC